MLEAGALGQFLNPRVLPDAGAGRLQPGARLGLAELADRGEQFASSPGSPSRGRFPRPIQHPRESRLAVARKIIDSQQKEIKEFDAWLAKYK